MSILKELNPQKNEIVRIKFKTINDIIDAYSGDFNEAEDFYNFSNNIKAYIKGGDFIVKERVDVTSYRNNSIKNYYISVKNHLDCKFSFDIYDEVIESIEIVNDGERFVSSDIGLLVVRVEDEMYINGSPLIWDEEEAEKNHSGSENYSNPNRKLLKMFENFIADLAVKESFRDMNEGE